jgi:hypothetical protein
VALMLRFILVALFLAFSASAFAEPLAWQKYTVPETGATVDLRGPSSAKTQGGLSKATVGGSRPQMVMLR